MSPSTLQSAPVGRFLPVSRTTKIFFFSWNHGDDGAFNLRPTCGMSLPAVGQRNFPVRTRPSPPMLSATRAGNVGGVFLHQRPLFQRLRCRSGKIGELCAILDFQTSIRPPRQVGFAQMHQRLVGMNKRQS